MRGSCACLRQCRKGSCRGRSVCDAHRDTPHWASSAVEAAGASVNNYIHPRLQLPVARSWPAGSSSVSSDDASRAYLAVKGQNPADCLQMDSQDTFHRPRHSSEQLIIRACGSGLESRIHSLSCVPPLRIWSIATACSHLGHTLRFCVVWHV